MTLIGKVDLTTKNNTTPYFAQLLETKLIVKHTLYTIREGGAFYHTEMLGTMMVVKRVASESHKRAILEVETLDNWTEKRPQKTYGIGRALIEKAVALSCDWRNDEKGLKLTLQAAYSAHLFYWVMGLRPDPSDNLVILDDLLKGIDILIKNRRPLPPKIRNYINIKRAAHAKQHGIALEKVSVDEVVYVNVTAKLRELYERSRSTGKKIDTSFLGTRLMQLPEASRRAWKKEIFSSPKIHGHDPVFLNQLLLEQVGEAPQKIRSIILSYTLLV